jgi:hypothetical protein
MSTPTEWADFMESFRTKRSRLLLEPGGLVDGVSAAGVVSLITFRSFSVEDMSSCFGKGAPDLLG